MAQGYADWDYRSFTIDRLAKLAECCFASAKIHGVRINKKNVNGTCVGYIAKDKKILFSKEYRNTYDFQNTAQMFVDFHFVLLTIHQNKIGSNGVKDDFFEDLKWYYKAYNVPG